MHHFMTWEELEVALSTHRDDQLVVAWIDGDPTPLGTVQMVLSHNHNSLPGFPAVVQCARLHYVLRLEEGDNQLDLATWPFYPLRV